MNEYSVMLDYILNLAHNNDTVIVIYDFIHFANVRFIEQLIYDRHLVL